MDIPSWVLALLVFPTVLITTKCPDDLTQLKDGSCVIILEHTEGLCNALEMCALLSQTKQQDYFLIGYHQRHLTYGGPKFTGDFMWTSITDVLQVRNKNRNGWRDANLKTFEQVSEKNEINWDGDQPEGGEHAVAVNYSTNLVHDFPLKKLKAQVVCELIGPTSSATISLVQLKKKFPVVLESLFNDDPKTNGCYVELTEPSFERCVPRTRTAVVFIISRRLRRVFICFTSMHAFLSNTAISINSGNAKLRLDIINWNGRAAYSMVWS
ncbi:hypothetical protein CSKR_106192 [Clonorchis sinensis]|uniref:Uncharacterized protein n=1 Tax=Clonorchis sinensis TaxID=79923 RepID=A0A419PU06_CLOSI|nr:hypothetical protein CSKR_106192 [Clonorchis sinensis]